MTSKLQVHQLEQIEHYLLEEGIESLDFYNEMLDHIILKLESDIKDGRTFEAAFSEIKHEFLKQKPYSWKNYLLYGAYGKSYKGVKALEIDGMRAAINKLDAEFWFGSTKTFKTKRLILFVLFLFPYTALGILLGFDAAMLIAIISCFSASIYAMLLLSKAQLFKKGFGTGFDIDFNLQNKKNVQLAKDFKLLIILKTKGILFIVFPLLLVFMAFQSLKEPVEIGDNLTFMQLVWSYIVSYMTISTAALVKAEYDKVEIQER